jgi:hypothetical protein
MHEQGILDDVLSRLHKDDCIQYKFSLVCSEQALVSRIRKDVDLGIRTDDLINRSVPRLKNYYEMDTEKVDVSGISAQEAAEIIFKRIYPKGWDNTRKCK